MSLDERRDIVLIGGGGHAAVCIDVMRSAGRSVRGYLAPAPGRLDIAYLGSDDRLEVMDPATTEIFVAIGDNRRRWESIGLVRRLGFEFATAISSTATVSPSAVVGCGTVLMPGSIINARSRIGDGVIVNTGASVDHDGSIGDAVHIAPGCHLAGTVTVEEGAFLGVGTSVIPERTIGAWSTVGAGSVVIRDLPPGCTAYGAPATQR